MVWTWERGTGSVARWYSPAQLVFTPESVWIIVTCRAFETQNFS